MVSIINTSYDEGGTSRKNKVQAMIADALAPCVEIVYIHALQNA